MSIEHEGLWTLDLRRGGTSLADAPRRVGSRSGVADCTVGTFRIASVVIKVVATSILAYAFWTSTPVAALTPLTGSASISAGGFHTCAVATTTGGVKCWGDNSFGQLGDGTTATRLAAINVVGLAGGVSAIATGYGHSCALTTPTGGVKCWGDNSLGQLGDGTNTDRLTPTDVVGLSNGVIAIAAGREHTCALTTSGGVKCWGENSTGQLGDGTILQRSSPVDVTGLTGPIIAIAAGSSHTCALTAGGGMKCWGNNLEGQLGYGVVGTSYLTAADVTVLTTGVAAIASGYLHTCARIGGGMKCWGRNAFGELGDGTTITPRTSPVDVSLTTSVNAIAAGVGDSCAVTIGGGVKCWGGNTEGEVGNGTTTSPQPIPVDVSGLTSGMVAVTIGDLHACALAATGGVKCWGDNSSGELGDGTFDQRSIPGDVVVASPNTLSVVQPGDPSSTYQVFAGVPFEAVIESDEGTVAGDVLADTTISLALTSGTGPLTGATPSCTIPAGSSWCRISGLILPTVQLTPTVVLTARTPGDVLAAGASSPFSVAVPYTMTVNAGTTPQSAGINTPFANALAVTVKDNNSPVSGADVIFAAPGSGASGVFSNNTTSITVQTDLSGVAQASFTANGIVGGPYTVSATATGVAIPATFSLQNTTSAVVAALTANGGGGQSTRVSTAFPMALTVKTTDAGGAPVPGATVQFTVPTLAASATLSATSAVTDAGGLASVLATASAISGAYQVVATSGAGSASFGLTNTITISVGTECSGNAATNADLVDQYYAAILRRPSDAGGKAFWMSEADRLCALGVDPKQIFFLLANTFYNSPEYLAFNRDNDTFLTDLFITFFGRLPDPGGQAYWLSQLTAGMTRNNLMASFLFSPEFTATMTGVFPGKSARAETYLVMNLYGGLLRRLADSGGYTYWDGRFRSAQCQPSPAGAVTATIDAVSGQFVTSGEYAARGTSNSQYVDDLYYSLLQRGGDLGGFNFWVGQLSAGMTRSQLRQQFLTSPEMQTQSAGIAAQGCLP